MNDRMLASQYAADRAESLLIDATQLAIAVARHFENTDATLGKMARDFLTRMNAEKGS